MQIALVIWTNVLIDTNIKDMNVFISVIIVLIMMEIPLTFLIVNELKAEALYKDVPEILSNKLFYLTILLVVFLMMLPFMLYRRFSRLIFSDNPY